ncbi:hypothetical protein GQX73_g2735 [Xylaria multiplex]|uniref:Uncharacterized protein n=1 Tax=Xylaria multiplex TaxID=323545 RepID=A0A7C8IRW7_9PEZI|nr:hypothetical protein GQX73_g2735 [Xylaria multiplex]
MSTQDIQDVVTEVEQLLDHVKQLKEDCAQKDTLLEQKTVELQCVREDCVRKVSDLAQKTAELQRAKEDCAQKESELEEKTVELQHTREVCAQKDSCLKRKEADFSQRNSDLALFLMGPKHKGQDVDCWLPLLNSLKPTVATAQPTVQRPWWTVQLPHNTPAPTLPTSLLESVTLLYGEAIAGRYDSDGCAAFIVIIRYLEVAEAAPIPMIMELLRCLLANPSQGVDHTTQFCFFFGTWQVIGLIRLRWPETERLTDIEGQYRERLEHSPPDFQLLGGLVAGASCGEQLSAFDDRDRQIPSSLSTTPHKYCSEQRTLLVAPIPATATPLTWAFDLRRHVLWLVDREKGEFEPDGRYLLQAGQGEESILVPSVTSTDFDFIFDHLY